MVAFTLTDCPKHHRPFMVSDSGERVCPSCLGIKMAKKSLRNLRRRLNAKESKLTPPKMNI